MLPLNPAKISEAFRQARQMQAAGRLQDAEAAYRRILAANPKLAEVHFQLGQISLARKDAAGAAKAFERAADLKPSEPAVWTAWARALSETGDRAAGKAFLARAKKARLARPLLLQLQKTLSPAARSRTSAGDVPPRDLHQVIELLQRGDFAAAERRVTALCASHPNVAVLFDMLATAQTGQGKAGPAEVNYRKAIGMDPGYAEARANFGRFLVETGRPSEAITQLQKSLEIAPKLASAQTHLAIAFERSGKTEAALSAARRAVALQPGRPDAQRVLVRGLLASAEYAEAERILAGLRKSSPADAEILVLHGEALAGLDRTQPAVDAFDAAIAAAPGLARPISEKALFLQRLGRFDEADALFRKAIEIEPGNGRHYQLMMAGHKARPDDPLIGQMQQIFEAPDTGTESRMHLGFALAKAMEDTGAHDRVFGYLRTGNDIMHDADPFDLDALRRDHDALIAAFEDTDFSQRTVRGCSDYAPIFVTGLPRSGTTLVESILAAHSQVTGGGELGLARAAASSAVFPGGGELRRLSSLSDARIVRIGQEIRTAGRRVHDGPLRLTDKGVQTYNFLGLIRLALPRSAVIVVQRDPRDTLLSMYRNLFRPGRHLYTYDLGDLVAYYREYLRIMAFWRRKMPRGFHEIRYEELVADPENQARGLVAACGLEWQDSCLNFHTSRRRVDTLSLHQVRQPIYQSSMKAWERYREELGEMLAALDKIEAEGKAE